jgi:phenylacetate-CoA ligase
VNPVASSIASLAVGRWGSARQLRRYQTVRLRALIEHAYRTVPFYRRRFDAAGVRVEEIRTLEDLGQLPLTAKSELRDAQEGDVISSKYHPGRLVRYGTGGSSGEPLVVRLTRREDYLLRAIRLDAMFRLGLHTTDRRAAVLFSRLPNRTSLLERCGLMRYRVVHAFDPPDEIIATLRHLRPDVLRGYPSVLSDLAGRLTDEDRHLIRPRFITTDSESLTTLARTRIEKGFGTPVFDVYDCFECNVIAYQCPSTGLYHVTDQALIVEVLVNGRPAQPGEIGEIAITALHSYAAPLVRYMPGDFVERGPTTCPCGASFSCLTQVLGRSHDRFLLPGGRTVQPKLLAGRLYPLCSRLQRYQIVQETINRVVLRLQPAPGEHLDVGQMETLRVGLAHDLGPGVTVHVKQVDHIPSHANGKFSPYLSDVVGAEGEMNELAAEMISRPIE